jgi:hypothetical protein
MTRLDSTIGSPFSEEQNPIKSHKQQGKGSKTTKSNLKVFEKLISDIKNITNDINGVMTLAKNPDIKESHLNNAIRIVRNLKSRLDEKVEALKPVKSLKNAPKVEQDIRLNFQRLDLTKKDLHFQIAEKQIFREEGSKISDSDLDTFLQHFNECSEEGQGELLGTLLQAQLPYGDILFRLDDSIKENHQNCIAKFLESKRYS